MRTKFFTILLLTFISVVFSQEQKLTLSEIAEFKAKIEKESKTIKTIKTDFLQYKHLDFLSKDIETFGKMSFKSPNLLNWQYTKPYNYSIVFKNNKVFINDQGKKNTIDAGNSKIFEKINKMIVGSVSCNMFDDKEFNISYYKSKEFYITKLSPKTKEIQKYIKQIDLYFPVNDVTVSQVKLNEPSGDYTKIVFKNKMINAKIDDSVFSN